MKYTAAYLLAVLGGNPSPDVAAIAKILGSVGIECDEDRAKQVVDACKGRDVNEIIANNMARVEGALGNTSVTTTPPNEPPVGNKPPVIKDPSTPPVGSPPPSPTGSDTFIGLFD